MSTASPMSKLAQHWRFGLLAFSAVASMWVFLAIVTNAGPDALREPPIMAEAYAEVLQDWDCVVADVDRGHAVLYRCEDAPENAFVTPAQVRDEVRRRGRQMAADSAA